MLDRRELFFFEWVVVDNCNLSCSYCVNKGEYSHKAKEAMVYIPGRELDIARKIVELSPGADHVIVNFTGGDPLLSKYFVEVISILASAGNIQLNLITNMKLLGNVADAIVEICPDMNIAGSIHAHFRSEDEIDGLVSLLNAYKGRLKISLSQVDHDLEPADRAKIARIIGATGMEVAYQRFIPPWTDSGKISDAQRVSDSNFVSSLGKRCCLGFSHFLLLPDGTFCYDLWCIDRTVKTDDFLQVNAANLENFMFIDMKKCPKTSCGCNYNVFQYQEYLAACRRLHYADEEVFGPENYLREAMPGLMTRIIRWLKSPLRW